MLFSVESTNFVVEGTFLFIGHTVINDLNRDSVIRICHHLPTARVQDYGVLTEDDKLKCSLEPSTDWGFCSSVNKISLIFHMSFMVFSQ